jgi:hypothetical protein
MVLTGDQYAIPTAVFSRRTDSDHHPDRTLHALVQLLLNAVTAKTGQHRMALI